MPSEYADRRGLGIAEEQGCLKDIDFLCGTFGKALASVGAFVVCSQTIRGVSGQPHAYIDLHHGPASLQYRVDKVRAIPSGHMERAPQPARQTFAPRTASDTREWQILPVFEPHHSVVIGESRDTILKAEDMQRKGFYVLPVRPPTVPEGTSRLRISLTAALTAEETDRLCTALATL